MTGRTSYILKVLRVLVIGFSVLYNWIEQWTMKAITTHWKVSKVPG